ncbi:MAG TPA: hypothetical protein VI113_04700 [Alphaproteobacteria bacterium]
MPHRKFARASFGKRLLATSSVLAIAAGISAAAHAANVTNPNPIPDPTVNTGQTVTTIVFNDGKIHTGSGSISGNINGIFVVDGSTVVGSIVNATGGSISSKEAVGIFVNDITITGGITNGGSIATPGAGISVGNGTTVLGSISNNSGGTIASKSGSGILVGGSTIAGGITNGGTIAAKAFGILVSSNSLIGNSASGGGIVNTGSISVAGVIVDNSPFGTGIAVRDKSTVFGGIVNSGTIAADNGIFVSGAKIVGSASGAIVNTGAISAKSGGIAVLFNATLGGGIVNSGSISAGGGGIVVAVTSLIGSTSAGGGIVNTGTITAGDGVDVRQNSTVLGGIVNSGSIAAFDGIVVTASKIVSSASGAIVNTGSISAGTDGIIVFNNSTVTAGISNTGAISAGAAGIIVAGSTVDGGISNSGTISTGGSGILVANNATVTGGITNSGTIASKAFGIGVLNSTVGGAISNSGTVTGTGLVLGGVSLGTGIAVLNGGTVPGGIVNIGTISGTAAAIDTAGVAAFGFTGDGAAVTIQQDAGLIQGAVLLSQTNADRLDINGGTVNGQVTGGTTAAINLAGGSLVLDTAFKDNIGAFNQTGGTVAFTATPNTALHGSLTAGTVTASPGAVFEAVEQGNGGVFAKSQTYTDVIIAGGTFADNFAATSFSPVFGASLTPASPAATRPRARTAKFMASRPRPAMPSIPSSSRTRSR